MNGQPRGKGAWEIEEEIIGKVKRFNRIINQQPWLGGY
ncbi:hypothetical protein MACK_003643 [Theileria orientalis]|uniref:Uncharacterized protein n=1 Tax=Theileria orientalis TaxID=68886 RepID=A0A976SJG6_THEOR|nr:hypothetical protein MACK_003643 [Theileria orientalis]